MTKPLKADPLNDFTDQDDFTPDEIASRRDEVVRRMLATPPTKQPRGTQGGKRGRPIAS